MDYESRVKTAEANLASVYAPQTDFLNKQVAELPAAYDTMRTSADQARVNAFRGIENTANSRGMFFSGQPIQKQMEYNFGTYNPALARIDIDQKNKKTSLEQQLINLGMQKNSQAREFVSGQIKAEEAARQKEIDRALAERRHQQSLAASRASAYASSSRAAAAAEEKYRSQFKSTARTDGSGYNYTGPNGRAITLAQYAAATGGGVDLVLDQLKGGSAYDKKIYQSVATAMQTLGKGSPLHGARDANGVLNYISKLDKGNFYGLR